MKRIFVAVDISEDARRKVSAYIETLRKEFRSVRVGWEKPEKLHLTLKFLGDCEEKQIDELEKIAAKIAGEFTRFELQIAETGVFPNARNPRVLWIDVKDKAGNLLRINERLETECARLGFEGERRKFVPHLTIGRVRDGAGGAGALARTHLEKGFEPARFDVSEIVIYQSKLLSTGSVYSVVARYILNKEEEKRRKGEEGI